MNKTKIEWVKNPDGTQGYTWNPITGCLNGCDYCYARKLANGRLKARYLANHLTILYDPAYSLYPGQGGVDPFYPRFWEDRIADLDRHNIRKPIGCFVCDMSDLFGIGVPEEWTRRVLGCIEEQLMREYPDRFYLLTKQPQNLINFSPFPDNCWVGVTATTDDMLSQAILYLHNIKAKIKYISFEPLLEQMKDLSFTLKYSHIADWVIIGAQTKPYKPPKIEWVREIVLACGKAGIPVFLKDNLYPLIHTEMLVGDRKLFRQEFGLRQEMPCQKPQ